MGTAWPRTVLAVRALRSNSNVQQHAPFTSRSISEATLSASAAVVTTRPLGTVMRYCFMRSMLMYSCTFRKRREPPWATALRATCEGGRPWGGGGGGGDDGSGRGAAQERAACKMEGVRQRQALPRRLRALWRSSAWQRGAHDADQAQTGQHAYEHWQPRPPQAQAQPHVPRASVV